MKTLLVEATLSRMSRVKDGSVNLTFNTMIEIDSEKFKLMDEYWKQSGWLAFKMNEFDGSEIPKINAGGDDKLSPSQSLRRSIFALHMAKGGDKESFPIYYNKVMAGFKRAVDDSFPEGE